MEDLFKALSNDVSMRMAVVFGIFCIIALLRFVGYFVSGSMKEKREITFIKMHGVSEGEE